MSFEFLKNIDKQSCTVYSQIKLLKSPMTANNYVKTKVWQEFYKTSDCKYLKKMKNIFLGLCEPRLAVKNI